MAQVVSDIKDKLFCLNMCQCVIIVYCVSYHSVEKTVVIVVNGKYFVLVQEHFKEFHMTYFIHYPKPQF